MSNVYSYTIVNKYSEPIVVETWQLVLPYLGELKSVFLQSNQEIIMISETGEWYIDSAINGKRIGKFRLQPIYNGETIWMEDDKFQIVCVNGVATFSEK